MNWRTRRLIYVWSFLVALQVVAVLLVACRSEIDCDDPDVWSTQQGVEQCAVNGGK